MPVDYESVSLRFIGRQDMILLLWSTVSKGVRRGDTGLVKVVTGSVIYRAPPTVPKESSRVRSLCNIKCNVK